MKKTTVTPADRLRRICADHGLRQTDFADLIQTDRRTINRWLAGEHAVPHTVALLLLAHDEGKIDLAWIRGRRTRPPS
jgi:transcriptional regulator with XRE-family HTH domain